MTKTFLPLVMVILMLTFSGAVVSCGTSSTTAPGGGLTVKPTEPGATAGPDYTPGKSEEIVIENYAYSPATLTVSSGTTVTWTNQDTVRHTVTTDEPLFDSGLLGKGQSYSYTFDQKGEYSYYCIPHPYMKGKIIVE